MIKKENIFSKMFIVTDLVSLKDCFENVNIIAQRHLKCMVATTDPAHRFPYFSVIFTVLLENDVLSSKR